jgi:hypothetical protein
MKQTSMRNMDAQYVIHLGDYGTGDTVVWSAVDCLRVFHQMECILPFLAKGKACPRHCFLVPIPKKEAPVVGVASCSMGSLNKIMTRLVKLSDNPESATLLAMQVKTDVYAIGAAATSKSADQALKAHRAATKAVVALALQSL